MFETFRHWMAARLTGTEREPGSGGWYGPVGWTRQTKAGVAVDEERALQCSPFYAACRTIADPIAEMDKCVCERDSFAPDSDSMPLWDHPVTRLFHNRPNSEMTPTSLFRTMILNAFCAGDAYAEIEWSADGRTPLQIWPIAATRVTKKRYAAGHPRAGALYFEVANEGAAATELMPGDVLHIPGMSFDGMGGLGYAKVGREAIGLGLAAEEFQQTFFGNNAIPGGMFESDTSIKEEERRELETRLRTMFSRGRRFLAAILPKGMKYTPTQVAQGDAQFQETREFQVREISRFTGVPGVFLGDFENAPYSKMEEQFRILVHALRIWIRAFQEEIDYKLLDGAGKLFMRFYVEDLLKADQEAWGKFLQIMFGLGVYSTNDIRRKIGENGVGPAGDQRMVATNLATLVTAEMRSKKQGLSGPGGGDKGTGGEGGTADERGLTQIEEGGVSSFAKATEDCGIGSAEGAPNALAFRGVLADAIGRVWRKEEKASARAWKKCGGGTEEFDKAAWEAWVTEFMEGAPHRGFVDDAVRPALTGAVWGQVGDDDVLADVVNVLVPRFVNVHCGSRAELLRQGVDLAAYAAEGGDALMDGLTGFWLGECLEKAIGDVERPDDRMTG